MTQKQIDEAKRTLPRILDVPFSQWTPEEKQLSRELDCRSMINSCLCYGGIQGFWREYDYRPPNEKSYAAPYIKQLGLHRVQELVKEQEEDFRKAFVFRDVLTDSEGVTYSTILWADEQKS